MLRVKVGSTAKDFESELNAFLTAGKGLLVLAPMVAQLHHSLPECVMAMNLTPDCARKVDSHGTPLIYSAFLDSGGYTDAKYIVYTKAWREARSKVLGYVANSSHTSPRARSLTMLQDIYQMSNRPSDANEIGLIVEYTFSDNSHPSSREFGSSFYNSVVGQLNGFWRGPGIPLEQLSKILKPVFKDLDLVDMPPATGTIGKKSPKSSSH